MRSNKFLVRIAGLVSTALLVACSGGGVDVSIEGNVTAPGIPPLPPLQGNEAIVAHGEITGTGGITINNVRYQAGSATVTVNGNIGTTSDLRLGHIVTLTGRINDDGRTGTADSVRFDANVIGPVEGVDAANEQLVIMGQTVTTESETMFGAGIDASTYAGLSVGAIAQVSGYADTAGTIRATRIDLAANGAELQLVGEVAQLDLANLLFRINRLPVDYSNAVLVDVPGGAPTNGMGVMVIGTLSAGLFEVERLVAAPGVDGSTGRRVQLAGVVTRFASTTDFDVNRATIRTDAGTQYQNGVVGDLALNTEVVVDGTFASNGRITADDITFGRIVGSAERLVYGFTNFTEISVPTVFNVTVSQGAGYSVEVFVDQAHANRIDVSQSGSRLSIALLPGNGSIQTLEAVVTMPALNRIDLSGVVLANLNDFDQPQMTVNVGGVSFLRGNGLSIDNLDASVSGVSRLDLGDIRPIGNASIDVSGVSQATLNMDVGSVMTGSVNTGMGTGTSTLFYYGTNVTVNVSADSLSSIVRLGGTKP